MFNESSGKTHIVSELCSETINCLRHQNLDDRQIIDTLLNKYEIDEEELKVYVDNMLMSLDELGLIEPC